MKESTLLPVYWDELFKSVLAIEFERCQATKQEGRFDALAAEWRIWGYRLALKITGCPEAAADAVQNALLRAYRSQETLSQTHSPRAWFRKVLVHCAIDQRPRQPENRKDQAQAWPDLDQALAVRRVLSKLEPNHRAVLALALGEGLTYDEIADLLDIPSGTVGSRLHHAKEAFRKAWGDER